MKHPASEHRTRIASLDALRTIAIFAVIVIHAKPFWREGATVFDSLPVMINQAMRFAVPAFFLMTGYLLAMGGYRLGRQVRRLIMIWLLWSLVYLIFIPDFAVAWMESGYRAIYWNLLSLLHHPGSLLYSGTRIHLWFLAASALAVAVLALWRRTIKSEPSLLVAILLYGIGLLHGNYAWLLGGGAPTPVPASYWFASGLVMLGAWFQGVRDTPRLASGVCLMLSGVALHYTEGFLLSSHRQVAPVDLDMLAGTLAWACGLLMIALAKPDFSKGSALVALGPYTLGIYAIHLLVLDAIRPWWPGGTWSAGLLMPVVVYAVSLLLVVGIARVACLKPFVK